MSIRPHGRLCCTHGPLNVNHFVVIESQEHGGTCHVEGGLSETS